MQQAPVGASRRSDPSRGGGRGSASPTTAPSRTLQVSRALGSAALASRARAGGLPGAGALRLSRPDEAREQAAARAADRIARTPPPAAMARPEAWTPQPAGVGGRLPDPVRRHFEPLVGADLSQVRVHDGPAAARLTERLCANAVTVGRDIWFAPGRYRPSTPAGRHLLAHELVHATHQRDEHVASRDPQGDVTVRGGIRFVGPAIVLDRGWTWSVTGHLALRWVLLEGGPQSTVVVDDGDFFGGGMLQRTLTQGVTYTLRIAGSIAVHESNLVLNDAASQVAVSAQWVIRPPAAGATDQDDAVELLGVPTVRPVSSVLTPGRSDWNIVVRDITRSRRASSQVGLHVTWTKSTSTTTGYGGQLDVGGGAQVSGSSSTTVSTSDEGVLPVFFRFTHAPVYGPPAPP